MNNNLFDYTVSMQDDIYKTYVRTLFIFTTLLMIFVAYLFRAPARTALYILILNAILFLILFPGRII